VLEKATFGSSSSLSIRAWPSPEPAFASVVSRSSSVVLHVGWRSNSAAESWLHTDCKITTAMPPVNRHICAKTDGMRLRELNWSSSSLTYTDRWYSRPSSTCPSNRGSCVIGMSGSANPCRLLLRYGIDRPGELSAYSVRLVPIVRIAGFDSASMRASTFVARSCR